MSEQDAENSPMRTEASHRNAALNDSIEEGLAANNSIIGKVKSRVSSIFPNSLSKWFSPSTKNNNNDSFNGSINNSGGISRRRRRIEVEEDEDDVDEEDDEEEADDDEDDAQGSGEFNENLFASQQNRIDDNSDEESCNSEEAVTTLTTGFKNARRDVLRSYAVEQPPTKRSRLNMENTIITNNNRNTPLMQRQPLLASTPDFSYGNPSLASGRSATRYTHLNLYSVGKEPAFNFQSSPVANALTKSKVSSRYDPDIIDLVPELAVESNIRSGDADLRSSRRSLNIPSSTNQSSTERSIGFSNLKRQSLASVKNELSLKASSASSLPRRTSTTIFENDSVVADTVSSRKSPKQLQSLTVSDQQAGIELNDDDNEAEDGYEEIQREKSYNGESLTFKRQKLTNGSRQPLIKNAVANLRDSVSESSDVGCKVETSASGSGIQMQRKAAGLFNISAANSRNGSRTSSFGNGLNFYTHLEGRKSLFAGGGPQAGSNGLTLNNSTLSLNSLNRRQFNASIYGSTSALSDSRLLNTFSPFYKGKTTYGGAAAYNKYITGPGAGASSVRITPTLIRPTSSLSTLSSSNNSIAAGTHAPENPSAISSTAKRILDLINDFATPLSEAKKMANNLKPLQNQEQHNQSSTKVRRFNETDLNVNRAMRLSQVRTPYARPSVTLQPATSVPPVRELQVPSMSQLLQMKKMQHTTERSRQIATENSCRIGGATAEYTLPAYLESFDSNGMQKQHTNKIKNKVTGSVRITGSKDPSAVSIDNEAPPTQLNLPNIAFPLMQSIPKFDINLLPGSRSSHSTESANKATASNKSLTNVDSKAVSMLRDGKQNSETTTRVTTASSVLVASTAEATTKSTNFIFSSPLQVSSVTTPAKNITAINGNYRFSPPMEVGQTELTKSKVTTAANSVRFSPAQQSQPQLKTGSVLDALKKPFTLPAVPANASIDVTPKVTDDQLFAQFKKSSHEWECDTCMIRNKQDVSKCVACETPRKHADVTTTVLQKSASNSTVESHSNMVSNFGNQFKKSSSEWECDTCMIRNKHELSKCIACETPRKQASSINSSSMGLSSQISSSIQNTFGDKFKPKVNSWECGTCLINNKDEANECVACQTKKPGSAKQTVSSKNDVPTATATDVGFKCLAAAQKASKWECEACMTRNDAAKLKCVCCEQAKPGSQTLGEEVPKFSFGSTSAGKFSFGFGTQNAPKEEELRKLNETATSDAQVKPAGPVTGFVFGAPSAAASPTKMPTKSSTGFSFGIKQTVETATKPSVDKDTTDSSKAEDTPALTGFKFGPAASLSVTTSSSAMTSTTTTTGGFAFGTSSTATKSSDNLASTTPPSVKFSLPTTSVASFGTSKPTAAALITTIGSSSTIQQDPATSFKPVQQTPTSGFSFGLSKSFDTAASTTEAPKNAAFAFKSPAATTTTSTTSSAGSAFTFGTTSKSVTTSIASAAPSTAVSKPMFSFGAATTTNSSTVSAEPTISVSSAKTNSVGFSFGSIAASGSPALPKSSLFGAVAPSTTATTAVLPPATGTQAITNVFGSFATASTNSTFGASPPNLSSAMSQGSNSSTTFGNLATSKSSSSFSSFSSNTSKPKATATISAFGAPSTAATGASTPFGFGSSTTVASPAANAAATTAAQTSSTAWPKNSFVFGASSSSSPAAAATSLPSNEPEKPPTFGSSSFGASLKAPANNASSSIFGANQQTSISSNLTSSATFGSAVSTPIFGLGSASVSAAVAPTNNLFGSTVAANASAPAFGSSPFVGKNASVGVTTTFGSIPLSVGSSGATSSFVGFGGVSQAASSNSTDGASAAKKSEPAFNFGATSSAQPGTSAGFNFGSGAAAAKPAFNFGASNASSASFNFSGATADTSKSTQPFQFGATPAPLAPVFNFRGGAVEATPNTPFQFNASAAQPASSNIFAPSPTPPGVQTAQQARRKIRAPMRRLTPR